MYLKEIELRGFKSFLPKTVLEFSPHINAIVGPNGSGKSNIIDALRWCLGDQSQKNLRIENSNGLIFTGNEFCKAATFAKVRLLFENVSQSNPEFDFNSLEIEKTIDNNGRSEYLVNKEPARLKDITEILSALKLGVKGFSIVNQGSIENILRVSPLERTIMLEEILGLRQLEIKKEIASRKLNLSLINLDKIKSLENEILPHYRSLKRNVSRLEKQKELQEELGAYEKELYSYQYREINKNIARLDDEIINIQKLLDSLEEKILSEEKNVGFNNTNNDQEPDLSAQREAINNQIKEINEEKHKLIYEMAKLESVLEEKKTSFNHLQNNGKNISMAKELWDQERVGQIIKKIQQLIQQALPLDDIESVRKLLKEMEKEISQITNDNSKIENNSYYANTVSVFDKEIKELQDKIKNYQDNIEILEQKLNRAYQELEQIQTKENQRNQERKNAFIVLEAYQKEKMQLLDRLQRYKLDKEKIKINLDNLRQQLSLASISWEDFINYAQNFDRDFNENEVQNLENKIVHLRKVLQDLGFVDQSTIEEYEGVKQRFEFLQKEHQDLEQAISDLKKVIKELTKQINSEFNQAVKEINREFNKYIQIIFGGGKGSLEIVSYEDLCQEIGDANDKEIPSQKGGEEMVNQNQGDADSAIKSLGVEIRVKLPKTKLEGVEALSGGEKALVAIALLFAIVSQSKPPLLVLDEVDAALDEENARRFGEILKELSDQTQFIIITHNWLTMEASDIIYGITLGPQKYSQVLSLQIEESRQFVKN